MWKTLTALTSYYRNIFLYLPTCANVLVLKNENKVFCITLDIRCDYTWFSRVADFIRLRVSNQNSGIQHTSISTQNISF